MNQGAKPLSEKYNYEFIRKFQICESRANRLPFRRIGAYGNAFMIFIHTPEAKGEISLHLPHQKKSNSGFKYFQ